MRIRKHAAALLLSATSSTTTVKLEPHLCQLNQSPWDVFSPPSPPLPLPPTNQVKKKHENENAKETSPPPVSISISPVKREEGDVSCDLKLDSSDCSHDDVAAVESKQAVVLQCCKTDGKSWRCRRDAVEGGAMCEHHLYLARNHGSSKVKRVAVVEVALPEATEKRRPQRPRKASSSSPNPYDFYYYSGFGPHWGKRRGKDHNKDNNGISTCNTDNAPTVISSANDVVENVSSPSQSINTEIDYIDDDEEEDSENEEMCKRKRARKPVKARSLKSLTM